MKKIRYFIEAFFIRSFLALFEILSLDQASDLGGALARTIGPLLAVNRKAKRHIKLAFPHITEVECNYIICEMWENLGRTFAEYPHLLTIAKDRVELRGLEHLEPLFATNIPAIMIAGHLANWEVAAASVYPKGLEIDLIYRAPNNVFLEQNLQKYRSMAGGLKTYPKSKSGMRQVMEALRNHRRIGILIDQKYNAGLAINFFGHTAMTSPVFVQLSQKFDCPVIPARVERLKGAHFRVTCYPPIPTENRALEDVINDAHKLLEQWITERPGQWLWLHRRWKE